MKYHHPVFFRLYDSTSTVFAVQNYYQQATITLSGIPYQFLDFSSSELVATLSADTNSVSVTLPAITAAVLALEGGIAEGWLAQIIVHRFQADTAPDTPPGGQVVMADIIGEVIGGGAPNDATITLEIGSALAPIGSQVPPRVFTPTLVGVPCRL